MSSNQMLKMSIIS